MFLKHALIQPEEPDTQITVIAWMDKEPGEVQESRRYPQETEAEAVEQLLEALRRAFEASPAPDSPLPGCLELTYDERVTWQHVQAGLQAGTLEDADVACLLAYYGVDYRRNMRRVLRGQTLGMARREPQMDGRPMRDPSEVLQHIPGHAARLYHRWRDLQMLEWLLGRPCATANICHACEEALFALWDDHWIEILRAARQSRRRCLRIARALEITQRLFPNQTPWRACLRQMLRAVYSRDPSLRRTAVQVLTLLRRSQAAIPPCRAP